MGVSYSGRDDMEEVKEMVEVEVESCRYKEVAVKAKEVVVT